MNAEVLTAVIFSDERFGEALNEWHRLSQHRPLVENPRFPEWQEQMRQAKLDIARAAAAAVPTTGDGE